MRTVMILCGALALTLCGCARNVEMQNVTPYRGLTNQPPFESGECLVLGHDNVWRRCQ